MSCPNDCLCYPECPHPYSKKCGNPKTGIILCDGCLKLDIIRVKTLDKSERIVSAAYIFDNWGDHNLISMMVAMGCETPIDNVNGYFSGFLTSSGKFVDREDGEKVARACGQLTKPLIGSILTSEDLW